MSDTENVNTIEQRLDEDLKDTLMYWTDEFGEEEFGYTHVPGVGLIARRYDKFGEVSDSFLVTITLRKYEAEAAK